MSAIQAFGSMSLSILMRDTVEMEVLYTVAAIAAFAAPGWLFMRVSAVVGSLVTLLVWFCAGFLGSLADASEATGRAIGWGAGFGAVGGTGFYLAKRFQAWEKRHPVDMNSLSKTQVRIRRVAIPLGRFTLVATIVGTVALALRVISFAAWVAIVVGPFLLCGILYFAFLKFGDSASRSRDVDPTSG